MARAVLGGTIAGIIAGAALAAVLGLLTAAAGQDLWPALKAAGAPFLGERSAEPGFDFVAVAVGVAVHFAVSITWGVLFGAIFFGLDRGLTVLMGAIWGVVVWLGMFWVVLPAIGLGGMREAQSPTIGILTHVIFGLALGVAFLPFQPRRAVPPHRIREPVSP